MTINYQKQFKALADRLALEPISERALERRVLRHLWVIDEDTGQASRAPTASGRSSSVLAIFRGRGVAGDTTGNSPGEQVGRVQRDRRAPRLRAALHGAHQPGAAVVRGHRAQAAGARFGHGGLRHWIRRNGAPEISGAPTPSAGSRPGCSGDGRKVTGPDVKLLTYTEPVCSARNGGIG